MALENIGELWRRAGLAQRVVMLGLVLACAGGGFVLVRWASTPSLSLLYSGLDPEEAATIVERVRDAGIAYELKQGGTAVYVPTDKVYSLRLTMASAGLPTGNSAGGYGLWDQEAPFAPSPFSERVRYQRAIEGEISRSIQELDAVVSARVHVVKPESALFRKDDGAATASVILKLKAGYQLTTGNVAAITHLVARCVEGLAPDKVSIVDGQGNLLSGEGGDEYNSRMTTVLEQKRQMEEYLARKAERQLELVLGPNRATVQVAVEMDTTVIESTSLAYGSSDKAQVAKEMIKKSSTEPESAEGGGGGATKDETIETEYKLPEKTETRRMLPGQITRKTVSVVVDLTPPTAEGEEAPAGLKMLALEDVKEIVTTALGLKLAEEGAAAAPAAGGAAAATPNDELAVKEATFYRDPELAAAAAAPVDGGIFTQEFILEIAKRGSLGLLVVGALLALKMFGGKKKVPPLEGSPVAALTGQSAQVGLLTAGAGGPESAMLKAQITRALQDNPDEVKRLFLSWAQGDKGE